MICKSQYSTSSDDQSPKHLVAENKNMAALMPAADEFGARFGGLLFVKNEHL